jgi:flagellin
MTTTGGAELISSTGFFSSSNPTASSDMYLSIMGNDTYTLQFGQVLAGSATASPATATNPVTFTYDGTSSSLTSIAADLEANLATLLKPAGNANVYDFSVSVENGRLHISEANGYDFALLGFESVGAGRISAALGDNQSGTGSVTSKLLDDTSVGLTASTTATSPTLAATEVTMAFAPAATAAASDTYSFEITDGSATAVISNVLYDGYTTTDTSMLAAINSALTSSGLSSVMTVAYDSTAKEFTLTHALGKEVRIQNFQSDNSQNLLIAAGAGTTGVTRYLDDNYTSASGQAVRNIAITSASLASDAVGIIDAALEDVASERANLGAIQNRLDHTINNLTNISTNTSASRSRIQDTDYGMETANLAKAQIIQQAATAMLAQANQSAQSVLSLLQ